MKYIKKQIELLKNNIKDSKDLYIKAIDTENEYSTIFLLSCMFMENILKDIEYTSNLLAKKDNERYINAILRITVEQVIIYRNIMKESVDNLKMCKDFLGYNINIKKLEKSKISLVEKLKKIIGKRTEIYDNNFYEMASTFEDTKKDGSIYKIYSLMADNAHNAYYIEILREFGEEDYNVSIYNTIILIILTNINEAYISIEDRYTEDDPLEM